jgi:hypothetical protein
MWNISDIWVAGLQMMQDVCIKLNPGKSSIQQEEDSFHQQTALKFKKKTSEMLHLGHSNDWC